MNYSSPNAVEVPKEIIKLSGSSELLFENPAYRTDVKAVTYKITRPGLMVDVQTGPYEGSGMHKGYPYIEQMNFEYEPARFQGDLLLKLALGNKPVTINYKEGLIGSVEYVTQSYLLSKSGDWLEITLNHTELGKGTFYLSRDTGRFMFIPGRGSTIGKEIWSAFLTQAQLLKDQRSGIIGSWKAIPYTPEEVAENLRSSGRRS